MDIHFGFDKKPLCFCSPEAIIRCHDPASLIPAFNEAEAALKKGFYVAGFVSYEAGYAFEGRFHDTKSREFPLFLMGVYRRPCEGSLFLSAKKDFSVSGLRFTTPRSTYDSHIASIRRFIALGDVYQITYCLKLRFSLQGDPSALYSELLRAQPVPYPAFIRTDGFSILSLSPERFVTKKDGYVETEPMKGTWRRGRGLLSDLRERMRFARDKKNRAENLMITDLLRNDLGRIGRLVRVPRIFRITPYKTLFQMTSIVSARVPDAIPLYRLFSALFPSGSVTGAPKIRAMEVIRELEPEERKIYTGAIGYVSPERDMFFNIPIRTILVQGGKAEMGIGGGIVWDSTPQGEWDEGVLKARFLTDLSTGPAAIDP